MIDFVLRFFDVLLSGVALLLLSPILLCIAGLLKITGEGDVLYKQVREGKNGKKISIIKFATMLRDSEKLEGGTVTRGSIAGFDRTEVHDRILKANQEIVSVFPDDEVVDIGIVTVAKERINQIEIAVQQVMAVVLVEGHHAVGLQFEIQHPGP